MTTRADDHQLSIHFTDQVGQLIGSPAEGETRGELMPSVDLLGDGVQDSAAGIDVVKTTLANQLGPGGWAADGVHEQDLQVEPTTQHQRHVGHSGAVR